VTSLGCGVKVNWENLLAGKSGIGAIQSFDVSDLKSKIAGQVPVGETAEGLFNADDWMSPKEQRGMDDFIIYGLTAAVQAVADSGWTAETEEDQGRTGVMIGSGIGGLNEIAKNAVLVESGNIRRVSPFFIPASLINLVSGHVSIKYGFKGPNHSVVTACSSGAHAIGEAMRFIQHGQADWMLAGGSDAPITYGVIRAWEAMRVLAPENGDAARACRPFSADRRGIVIGEGAAVLLLEEYEVARKRGARIYAELAGYGANSDASHITQPSVEGPARAMQLALDDAGLNPEEVDYINAHGTATRVNDVVETRAIKQVFGARAGKIPVSSTKSMHGHVMGASGAIELVATVEALRRGVLPPTANYSKPDPDCDLDYVPNQAREQKVRAALSNSFAFGGLNAVLVVKQV